MTWINKIRKVKPEMKELHFGTCRDVTITKLSTNTQKSEKNRF